MRNVRTIAIVYNAMQSVLWRRELISAIIARGHRVIAIAPFDGFEGQVRRLGVTAHPIPMSRMGWGLIEQGRVLRELVRLFAAEQVNLAFLTTIKPIILGTLAARISGISDTYAAITGLGTAFDELTLAQRLRARLAKQLYRYAIPYARKILFQNPDDVAVFRALGFLRDDQILLTSGSGVNLSDFTLAPPVVRPIHFLMVARMLVTKGVREFVCAARALKRRHQDAVYFTLVGPLDSNLDAVTEAQLRHWTLDGSVTYAGAVSDVRPHLRQSSVYVLPSYYREGVPRTILEAMAMGRPIITTNLPGCRETVRHGENGFLIPPRDTSALIDAMTSFIDYPELIPTMGMASRSFSEARFDQRTVNSSIIDALCL